MYSSDWQNFVAMAQTTLSVVIKGPVLIFDSPISNL